MGDTINGYDVHPTAALFPLMEGEAWREFVEDIRRHGLLDPIVVDGKTILDGRNRMLACRSLGMVPRTKQWNREGSVVDYIVSMNIKRRHLDKADLALLAIALMPQFEAEAKERQRVSPGRPEKGAEKRSADTGIPFPPVRDQAAKAVGIGKTTVGSLLKLTKEAPDLVEEVRAKRMTVNKAARIHHKRAGHPPGFPHRSPEAERRRLENERAARVPQRHQEEHGNKLRGRINRAARVATNIMHSLYAAVSSLEEIELYITDDDRLKIRDYLSQIRRLTKLSKERLNVAKD